MKSLPKDNSEVESLETSAPPVSSSLRFETAALEVRKDCYKNPRVIHVTLKNSVVNPGMVDYFRRLGKIVKAIPSYPVVDIPGYFKMGFCMNTPEIYIWVRQKPSSDFEAFLMTHLRSSLQEPAGPKPQE
ncbi:MAG TPA: hypothetical protein VMN77_04875 [Nitrospiria bacterium]|nr:hypothetical protein [Nitrospiria bacterium]